MDPTLKAQWLTALRSGTYAHATGFLRTADTGQKRTCCAFGILADIIAPDAWIWSDGDGGEGAYRWIPDQDDQPGYCMTLPQPIQGYLRMFSSIQTEHIFRLSDASTTFALVANYIERQL